MNVNWRKRKVHVCGTTRLYCERWDAYYCPKCDTWLEPECSCEPEDECEFVGRPDKPSQVV